MGALDRIVDHPDHDVVVCAGRGAARRSIVSRLRQHGVTEDRFTRCIHPGVEIPAGCDVGPGSILLAGVVLTANVTLGSHVVVMPNATLTHDDVVEDFATICAGVSLGGGVHVGSGAYLGMNASVREHQTVGADATLGMGAALVRDLPPGEPGPGRPRAGCPGRTSVGRSEMRFERPRPLLTRPSVSVVVPCYNYGHYLGDAVTGVLDQEGLDVEVIIVDDASPDGSVRVARELAAADERVQVIAHTTNKGHIATYNNGLREIKGDYVVLLSADDALPHNALTRSIALMEHHPEVGMVYGFPDNFTETPPTVPDRVRSWTTWHGRDWFRRACRTGRNVLMNPRSCCAAPHGTRWAGTTHDSRTPPTWPCG